MRNDFESQKMGKLYWQIYLKNWKLFVGNLPRNFSDFLKCIDRNLLLKWKETTGKNPIFQIDEFKSDEISIPEQMSMSEEPKKLIERL